MLIELTFAAFVAGKLVGFAVHPQTFDTPESCAEVMRALLAPGSKSRAINIRGSCRSPSTMPI